MTTRSQIEDTREPIIMEQKPVYSIRKYTKVMPELTKYEYLKIHSINVTKENVTVVMRFRPTDFTKDYMLYFRR